MKELGHELKYWNRFRDSQTAAYCPKKGCKADRENKISEQPDRITLKEITKEA